MKFRANGLWKRSVVVFFIIAVGCMSGARAATYENGGGDDFAASKRITNLEIVNRSDTISLLIRGSRLLTYTTVKQASPQALILYFSNTLLDTPENVFTPPNNVIRRVQASAVPGQSRTIQLRVHLKKNAYYEITRRGNGLKVSFSKVKTARMPESGAPEVTQANRLPAAPVVQAAHTSPPRPASNASRLQSVYAAKFGDSLKVFVGADGMITNYKSFTIESPPRIVFDIFNIQSPYQSERVVPVNTQWVSQIRYHSYPDRVRVILDTRKAYLSKFSGHPVENGLLIQMGAAVSPPETPKQSYVKAPASKRASRVESVYATRMADDGMLITIKGDGAITNYKTAVAQDPPRIIVNLYDVDSPYLEEQSFPVDTQWVRSVRHQRYPDRIQVTIETRSPWLSSFSAFPDKNGLVVRVGGKGTVVADTGPRSSGQSPQQGRSSAAADYTQPATVSQVDFQAGAAGKSTLVVGTTRPVQYEVKEVADRKLEVRLLNTRLPDQHKRPLITDRFESAVDRIMPESKPAARNTAFFDISLREGVPYFVEQTGNELRVQFEASSISPRPIVAMNRDQAAMSAPPPASPLPPEGGGLTSVPIPRETGGSVALQAPSVTVPVGVPGTGDDLSLDIDTEEMLGGADGPRYTGEKIALDFYETDIKNVFRILREVSGKNFAIDKDVTGKVTLTLGEPVPWDQVLDLVLKMNKLGKTVDGTIIRIATRATLDEEERIRQEKKTAELTLRDQQKQLEPVKTEYIPVNYSRAKEEIEPHIEKLLTKDRGAVSVDERTNVVIITDTADKIRQARELIEKLDRVTPQVIIEARVVEATTSFSREIGTQWEMGVGVQEVGGDVQDGDSVIDVGGVTDDVANSVNNRIGVGPERGYDALGGTYGYNMAQNFPISSEQYGSIGFNFMRIAGTPLLLNVKLQAMESQGEVKIISAPKVLTLDNKKAVIRQGLSYPYQTVEDGEVNLEFKDVDLLLEVTPHVTPDNRISMSVNITKNDLGSVINGEQSFTTKEAQTELLVNDGDTVVIGGIIKTTENNSVKGLPGLSRIPIIGWFFKTESKSSDKEELLIFITPRIVQLEQRTAQF
ncbi:hypothetical protein DENIS_4258 [Desulfonema ishimotonii]|uniref:Type IV pilus secretin PilQ n=1 Tax=Desulfonema ishimotonii TaxID=45657 RepID=A0A401G222_9BACT|nr:type IV pilus secretin family protein [Desulfonema ishimotonii]GBC63264.1 hypothetical protein DENIS_4258 [Desulfonema ishimotonii]